HRHAGTTSAWQVEYLLEAPFHRAQPRERAPAGAAPALDHHDVGHFEANQRQRAVEEVRDEQACAGLAIGHRAAVAIDVLHHAPVLEEVDAVVVLAVDPP